MAVRAGLFSRENDRNVEMRTVLIESSTRALQFVIFAKGRRKQIFEFKIQKKRPQKIVQWPAHWRASFAISVINLIYSIS